MDIYGWMGLPTNTVVWDPPIAVIISIQTQMQGLAAEEDKEEVNKIDTTEPSTHRHSDTPPPTRLEVDLTADDAVLL